MGGVGEGVWSEEGMWQEGGWGGEGVGDGDRATIAGGETASLKKSRIFRGFLFE